MMIEFKLKNDHWVNGQKFEKDKKYQMDSAEEGAEGLVQHLLQADRHAQPEATYSGKLEITDSGLSEAKEEEALPEFIKIKKPDGR